MTDNHLSTLEATPFCLELYATPEITVNVEQDPALQRYLNTLPKACEKFLAIVTPLGIPKQLGLKPEGQEWEIDLTLTDNPTIQALNQEHRGKDSPTDVLSFTLLSDSPVKSQMAQLPTVQLGSLFLSVEWAKASLAENPLHPFQEDDGYLSPEPWMRNILAEEVLNYYLLKRTIHGFLHLMGVNHDTDEEYNRVVGIQTRVLHEIFAR
ncbi:MAG: rRNA maturation RNase YbeY [Cyanobacteria bacterium]|nr:rRNA maturation RNase YbeY [Cyanobacteriota bacterium]